MRTDGGYGMPKKTAYEIVIEAFDELEKLSPTIEEIREYADLNEGTYGVVTYSKSRPGGNDYFLRFHDTWKRKFGGKIHIDVGYVDEKYKDKWNFTDTTHLMLDKESAPDFVNYIKRKRKLIRARDSHSHP